MIASSSTRLASEATHNDCDISFHGKRGVRRTRCLGGVRRDGLVKTNLGLDTLTEHLDGVAVSDAYNAAGACPTCGEEPSEQDCQQ
jgi:hypothetical protein